jgi:putative flippase GtrA
MSQTDMWQQIRRFGLVGILATAVHMATGTTLIHFSVAPQTANPVAFAVALCISFAGHFGYSFAGSGAPIWCAAGRFALAAIAGFVVNQSILVILLSSGWLTPIPSLVVSTCFAATVVFLMSKFWAFRNRDLRPDQLRNPS